ncbi:MAG: hypothetical protein ACR2JO_07250 [Mycobacteriales bacterium]
MVEPDIIGTGDRPPRRRPGWALPAAALAAAGLAAVVITANARQPAPRPSPPTPSRTSAAEPIDFDPLVQGGPCGAIDTGGNRLSYLFGIENVGPQPLYILSVSRPAAGLQLITVGLPTGCDTSRAPPPFSQFELEPGRSRLLLLRYRVVDCAAARSSDRVPATVRWAINRSVRTSRIGLPARASGPCT